MDEIFVARHPIFDRHLELAGYELLYRDNTLPGARFSCGNHASSRLIVNTFMEFGLENIVGSNLAFINLTQDFFINEQPIPMNREQVVLEISEPELPEPHVLQGLQELAAQGYEIALDDFIYKPEIEPLLQLATIVKIDLKVLGREAAVEQAQLCRPFNVKLLAEKVETSEDVEYCMAHGFDYFQGFFFCKPQLIAGTCKPANQAVILQLLDKLQAGASPEELEQIVIQDIALSYKLLRYINCAAYANRSEINSVREALMLIGTTQIKKWALLLVMSSTKSEADQAIILTSMVRARVCALLAQKRQPSLPEDQAFTVGLFAKLSSAVGLPMEQLLDELALSTPIKIALDGYEGELGQLLEQTLNYEQGQWSKLEGDGLSSTDYAMAYLSATEWANEITRAITQLERTGKAGAAHQ